MRCWQAGQVLLARCRLGQLVYLLLRAAIAACWHCQVVHQHVQHCIRRLLYQVAVLEPVAILLDRVAATIEHLQLLSRLDAVGMDGLQVLMAWLPLLVVVLLVLGLVLAVLLVLLVLLVGLVVQLVLLRLVLLGTGIHQQ